MEKEEQPCSKRKSKNLIPKRHWSDSFCVNEAAREPCSTRTVFLTSVKSILIEQVLDAEMDEYLSYPKHASIVQKRGNGRNGHGSEIIY